MKKKLMLLSLLFHPLFSFTFVSKKQEDLRKEKKETTQHINEWFKYYSCSELEIQELKLIAAELDRIIEKFDGNIELLEKELADYCHVVADKHVHSECFSAVVKACEDAIFRKYKKPSSFKTYLLGYSQKIQDTVVRRTGKNNYILS